MSSPDAATRPRPDAATPQDLPPPKRALPVIDLDNEAFWSGGAQGELRIYRCQDCAYYVHPPVRFCPKCESRKVEPEAVSGRGYVTSFTVNHKQWVPGLPVPYVLALVSIAEQDDVRLVTNIVNCDPNTVTMGMPLKVLFEQSEDVWIPLFEPEAN
ncbi:MAG: DNA-binding protein [Phenylobacterium sp.]|nr:DNA-binding protein [Phenylobacterium sp.]